MRNRVKFDPKVDYYKKIYKNVDITDQEIQKAYNEYVEAYAETKRKNQELLDQAIASKDSDLLSKAVLAMQASNSDFEEIDKAFEVLIYSREEYDKKRAKYLKDATKNNPVVVDEYEDFDVMKDYYDFLKIDSNAKLNDILAAYSNLSATIIEDDVMSQEEKDAQMDELTEALRVLSNDELRALYDEARAKFLRNNKITRHVVRVVDEEEADEEKTNKAKFILGLLTTAAVIAILYFGGKALVDNISNKFNENKKPIIEQEDPNYTDDKDVIVDEEPKDEEDNIVDNTVDVKVNYYGDINDDKLVTERATTIVNQFNNNGIINIATGGSYTVQEVKDVILYMNGAYVPYEREILVGFDKNGEPITRVITPEEDALTMTDTYLNFVCALGSSEHIIYQVNYLGGEESFKPALDDMNASYQPLCIVDNMLFGDSTAYPYLKWLENNYNAMVTTTDRTECNRIFEETTQSIVEITCGNGYELDGVLYTKSDFTGLDKINAGNVLQLYVFNYQVFRTHLAKDEYSFNNTLLGLDNETNLATYNYDDVMVFYNALCDSEVLKQTIMVDDSGEILLVNPTNERDNFSQVNQINTVNALLQNYYLGNKTITVENAKSLN